MEQFSYQLLTVNLTDLALSQRPLNKLTKPANLCNLNNQNPSHPKFNTNHQNKKADITDKESDSTDKTSETTCSQSDTSNREIYITSREADTKNRESGTTRSRFLTKVSKKLLVKIKNPLYRKNKKSRLQ